MEREKAFEKGVIHTFNIFPNNIPLMKELLLQIQRLERGPIGTVVRKRAEGFKAVGKSSSKRIFSELCFCILTANYSAEGGIKIQNALQGRFHELSEAELARELKKLGYLYPNARARNIAKNQLYSDSIKSTLASFDSPDGRRRWLVSNIIGFGYKEASHFLRNIGYDDHAIIDFHILDLMARHGMIGNPKSRSLNRKRYLDAEQAFMRISKKTGIAPGALDLYLWYIETGKILK